MGNLILFLIISVNIFTLITALNYQFFEENEAENEADTIDELYAPYGDDSSRYAKRSLASNPYGRGVEKRRYNNKRKR